MNSRAFAICGYIGTGVALLCYAINSKEWFVVMLASAILWLNRAR